MEDEDLDELLDDVERRFCRGGSDATSTGSSARGTAGHVTRRAVKPEQPISSDLADLDALLEDFLDESGGSSLKAFPERGEKKPSSQSGGRKCCPVFVGGSSVPSGVGTATSKRSCDQLRCTSCDFRVLTFDDCEWDASCDYLFLRNNVPDRLKLAARLKKRSGSRAFACQCSWFTATEPTDLRGRAGLRWVCGRHRD
ncbi:cilia- and flagella-associated protein 418 isoform X2 [Pseudoliparis swirei]|uniref:cilia- and flagella-associated protein 418 isoform X2 n=1 Tax=Pseudoliparis swirei TaxID=2059687 RepID=UPI0024BE6A16|nr:cilia- and flagella-associated protein 418 isoform X2 [Pseudoliparis swirei]